MYISLRTGINQIATNANGTSRSRRGDRKLDPRPNQRALSLVPYNISLASLCLSVSIIASAIYFVASTRTSREIGANINRSYWSTR